MAILVYIPLASSLQQRNFKIQPILEVYARVERGTKYPVDKIANVRDDEVFVNNSSNLAQLDEAIFGYHLEYFKPEITYGSIFQIDNGYLNMTNPASYVFPRENNLSLFERFHSDQMSDLKLFANQRQTSFQISISQKVSNVISAISFAGILLYFFFLTVQHIKKVKFNR